jgi:hypothetical protein
MQLVVRLQETANKALGRLAGLALVATLHALPFQWTVMVERSFDVGFPPAKAKAPPCPAAQQLVVEVQLMPYSEL